MISKYDYENLKTDYLQLKKVETYLKIINQ